MARTPRKKAAEPCLLAAPIPALQRGIGRPLPCSGLGHLCLAAAASASSEPNTGKRREARAPCSRSESSPAPLPPILNFPVYPLRLLRSVIRSVAVVHCAHRSGSLRYDSAQLNPPTAPCVNRDCVSLYSFSWDGGSVQNDLTFGRLDFFSLELSRGAFGEQDVTSVVVDMELLVCEFAMC